MKILIIEDDKFFRDFYAFKLKEKNFEVEVAENGEVGLQKVSQVQPDVILLDLIMPKKDGFAVLEALSQQGLTQKIPVLIFSTLGQEREIEKARSLGARGYVSKTFFDFDKLLQRILEVSKN